MFTTGVCFIIVLKWKDFFGLTQQKCDFVVFNWRIVHKLVCFIICDPFAKLKYNMTIVHKGFN